MASPKPGKETRKIGHPHPLKQLLATETRTRITQDTSPIGRGGPLQREKNDTSWWKPEDSGTFKAECPSREKRYQDLGVECENYVWNWKVFLKCGGDEALPASVSFPLISETRWIHTGWKKLNSSEMLLYSGHEEEDSPNTQGMTMLRESMGRYECCAAWHYEHKW